MKPSLIRNPPARAMASRSGTAQWCSSRMSAGLMSLEMPDGVLVLGHVEGPVGDHGCGGGEASGG
jgi:hypothetical protein